MTTKFYAVKKGRTVGIFTDWDACCKSVNGFAGAEYKSFKKKTDATAYLSGYVDTVSDKKSFSDIPICPENELIAFVDGSFDAKTGQYAYGCVIITPTQDTVSLNGKANNPAAATARNVAGELLGTMTAIKFAAEKGIKTLTVYHDYEGIEKWYNRKWRAQSFVAVKYAEFTEKYKKSVSVRFIKVEAHTGNTLNEEADRLAKAALGINK